MEYVAIAIISLFTSTLSGMAGGGGALMTAPAMLLIGFAPNTVVATQKAGGIGINLGAMIKFLKHKELIQWQIAGVLSVLAVIAAYIGTHVVFSFSEEVIRNAIAIIVILTMPVLYFRRKDGLQQRETSQISQYVGYGIYTAILTVQAAVGGGIGTLNMFVLMGPMGLNALQANATKRVVGFVLTFSSMLFFISSGYVDWKLAGIILCTTLVGGYVGASIAIDKGSKFVRATLVIVSTVMAILILLD